MQQRTKVEEIKKAFQPESQAFKDITSTVLSEYKGSPIEALIYGFAKTPKPKPERIDPRNLQQDNIWESKQVKEERRWRKDAEPVDIQGSPAELEKQALEAFVPALIKAGAKSPEAIANVLANIKAESSFDYGRKENMKYSTAGRLDEIHGARLKHDPRLINAMLGQPFDLAQEVYGKRGQLGKNGKQSPEPEWVSDDPFKGSKFRGRGYIQLTSPGNYKNVNDHLNKLGYKVDLMKDPDLITKDPKIAAEAALYFMTGGEANAEKFKDMNKTFSRVGFAHWDKPEGEKERQTRIAYAQELLPKVKDYMNKLNPPKKDKRKPA